MSNSPFNRFAKGLREEVENLDFFKKQEITNYVRYKMHRTWAHQDRKINKLKTRLKECEEALAFYKENSHYNAKYEWCEIHHLELGTECVPSGTRANEYFERYRDKNPMAKMDAR